ncbi:Cell cycle serine/threonine-protein kinase hsk1 [Schizosaccharomyces pombe]
MAEAHITLSPKVTHEQQTDIDSECEITEVDDENVNENKSQEMIQDIPARDREEIENITRTFVELQENYRLIEKIGEGTFSSVYKAEDLHYGRYINDWDIQSEVLKESSFGKEKIPVNEDSRKPKYEDQVLVVLPYYEHTDFRQYYSTFSYRDMSIYFRCLFQAMQQTQTLGIIHRDIKPSNFLFDVRTKHGVLVDFGLAERYDGRQQSHSCRCTNSNAAELAHDFSIAQETSLGYIKNDTRPSKRANRAGTRGFRAPEVLFKCSSQSPKVDIWSAGVILLSFLTKRFPMFNSKDDVDALMEIACIFGKSEMRQCAALHGCTFETNVSTLTEKRVNFRKLILWASCGSASIYKEKLRHKPSQEERLCLDFLEKCLELDCNKRISAEEALDHDFLYLDNLAYEKKDDDTAFDNSFGETSFEKDEDLTAKHLSHILDFKEQEETDEPTSLSKRKRSIDEILPNDALQDGA